MAVLEIREYESSISPHLWGNISASHNGVNNRNAVGLLFYASPVIVGSVFRKKKKCSVFQSSAVTKNFTEE